MSLSKAPVRDVMVNYGPRKLDARFGGTKGTKDTTIEMVWDFTYDSLPEATGTELALKLPAGAVIKSGYLVITEEATGLTDMDINLVRSEDGTFPIPVAANLTATSGLVDLTGAAGLVVPSDVPYHVIAVTVAGATAGKFRLVLEYVL